MFQKTTKQLISSFIQIILSEVKKILCFSILRQIPKKKGLSSEMYFTSFDNFPKPTIYFRFAQKYLSNDSFSTSGTREFPLLSYTYQKPWHIWILGDIWIQRLNILRLKFGGDLHKTTQISILKTLSKIWWLKICGWSLVGPKFRTTTIISAKKIWSARISNSKCLTCIKLLSWNLIFFQ